MRGCFVCCVGLLLLGGAGSAVAQALPPGLPEYDVNVVLDTRTRDVEVQERVSWTNRGTRPTKLLVFNAHARYSIPDQDVGLLAKMVEILRVAPKEALNFDGPALKMQQATLLAADGKTAQPLAPTFDSADATTMTLPLPFEVLPGASVSVELRFTMKLPAKKGRWGQWLGITTLAQWLPVVSVFNEKGWQPAPFIPWHQPFHNDAGLYRVQVKLPCDQKLAASGSVRSRVDLKDGWQRIEFEPICVRDFALIASAKFIELNGESDGVKVRCLVTPEHEPTAKLLLQAVCEAIPVYNQWFGRYPYLQFTFVESSFGWNGNECGGLVMIDDRMLNMPKIARNYPVYLIQHELCHQWWYNVVGTNGYAETWMDEGLATYFSHRLADRTLGKNNRILELPKLLDWAPNIRRDDLRNYGMYGARARGENLPTVQELPKYGHLVNLTSATYDRGSKIVGMIEERLGEQAFLDFMRGVYRKYQFRILYVADFQRELEAHTGRPWNDFFQQWVYGSGMCDWSVERVEVEGAVRWPKALRRARHRKGPVRVVVELKQSGCMNEPTVLGIRTEAGEGYQIRIPIHPDMPVLQLEDGQAKIECACSVDAKTGTQNAVVRVELLLPCEPLQVTVDPDHVLLDAKPTNNHWKSHIRVHPTPLYTQLDEIDVTNSYDKWNINVGPWLYFASYNDPWYTRQGLAGLRAGVYRTQEFMGGAYLAYRGDDRNLIAGFDALWDHVPLPNTQIGLTVERSLGTLGPEDVPCSRGVLYGRYVMMYGSSMYLPPFEYLEAFGVVQNRCLPNPRVDFANADPFDQRAGVGLHYHKNLLTPYWDPEGGIALDVSYQYGVPVFGNQRQYNQVYGQVSFVKPMPKVFGFLGENRLTDWLHDSRWAFRAGGAAALPNDGQFFTLGGGERFRGFDLAERQGSVTWVGSLEWRLPIARNLTWDFVDHIVGVRNIYAVPFYDIGDVLVNGHSLGPVAHAIGVGIRVDTTWLGLIERTSVRFDIATSLVGNAPVQFWLGIQHPF